MRCFSFELVVNEEITEELTEQLLEASCDDGCVGAGHDVWFVHFEHDADNLEHAIRTARDHVQSVGLAVRHVVIEDADIASALQETS